MEGAFGLLVALVLVPALGRHEHLAAVEPGGADRPPDRRLVAVGGGGVDVAVAGVERLRDDLLGLLRRHLEDAEAELRDPRAVAQRDGRSLSSICRGAHDRAVPIPAGT